ncbi:hypothetical protein SAMN05660209_04989 [Geodermatophilus africanus]|uniref:LSDAT prokaryote domain-containing protein n=1 Tax=Geodermatophilus africanus TaxID=1137993 RepID=A0A1H3R0T9_9ACTN|nr:hypothetical protein [Geodermatophilus africanus]SDZ19442.1 hypothetical protein SAMN05660209_04989 [Geodermatophilus africanus]
MSGQAAAGPGASLGRVDAVAGLPTTLDRLGILRGRPVLALVGGAAGMDGIHLQLVDEVFRSAVIPVVDGCGGAVVDGGTDAGIMRLIGQVRSASGASFPLVGVAAEGTVAAASGAQPKGGDTAELEPHHTHVILVPGDSWGDESPWLAAVVSAIAGGKPSATLVVNGGEITYADVERSLAGGRPVLVLAGTGRTADAVAAAAAGKTADPRAVRLAASPLTRIIDVGDPELLARTLQAVLTRSSSGNHA